MSKLFLFVASTISGQISVVQSLTVPPPVLPEDTSNLTALRRQMHSKYIKKWEPFGYRKYVVYNKEFVRVGRRKGQKTMLPLSNLSEFTCCILQRKMSWFEPAVVRSLLFQNTDS